jgi:hypothetical protein
MKDFIQHFSSPSDCEFTYLVSPFHNKFYYPNYYLLKLLYFELKKAHHLSYTDDASITNKNLTIFETIYCDRIFALLKSVTQDYK